MFQTKDYFLLLLALNDSNRFLRDERDQLKSKLELNEKLLKEYETKLTPLREQIVKFQEELDKEKAENLTLKTDGQRWRQRVNQLIEKHQKISPEELLKVKCGQIIHIYRTLAITGISQLVTTTKYFKPNIIFMTFFCGNLRTK